jgi:hypothetical protein
MAPKKRFTAEEAKAIGEKLGIDWSKFDVEQFRAGMDVELEHGLRDLSTNVRWSERRKPTGRTSRSQVRAPVPHASPHPAEERLHPGRELPLCAVWRTTTNSIPRRSSAPAACSPTAD